MALIFKLVQYSCSLLLIGRGWQFFFKDIPFRTILWNEGLLKHIVESFGVSWQSYVTSEKLDFFINLSSQVIGIFFFVLGFLILSEKLLKKIKIALVIASSILGFVFLLQFMSKFFYIGMLIEHALQWWIPLLLYFLVTKERFGRNLIFTTKLSISLTFVGHALFAVGFHPVPGPFIDMLINVFSVSQETAIDILVMAGSIDIACAIFLFLPPLDKYALRFMIFWGLATASARVLAHVDWDNFWYTSHQWAAESLYRVGHGLIPLCVYLMITHVNLTKKQV